MSEDSNISVNFEGVNCKGSYDTVTDGIYRIQGHTLYKKNLNGGEDIVNPQDSKPTTEFLKAIRHKILEEINEQGNSMKGQAGGGEYKIDENMTISLTDDTCPILILNILKEMKFKVCRKLLSDKGHNNSIQSYDMWYENSGMNINLTDSKQQENKEAFGKFLKACVEFINRNPGLLNHTEIVKIDESGKEAKEIEPPLQEDMEMIGAGIYSSMYGGFNFEGGGLENLVDVMRSSQKNRMTGGGKNKSSNKLFKCAATSKLNNLIKNINGKVDNSYFQNLRNTSRELSKNEKSLNNHKI